jgi:hypothetical protein
MISCAPGEVQFGLQVNCDKNKCRQRHRDHGFVYSVSTTQPEQAEIGNHICDFVTRTIPDWGQLG